MFQTVKAGTKQAEGMLATFNDRKWCDKGSIYEAYGRCSSTKVAIWKHIEERAQNTPGYNHDLRVVSRNTFRFSTMYSFTDADGLHIVLDTPSTTKELVVA